MTPAPEQATEWQLVALGDEQSTLVADLVALAPEQTGLLSIRLGVDDPGERSALREYLQRCTDTDVPLTVRWVDAEGDTLLLLTTADGMLVVTACDRPL